MHMPGNCADAGQPQAAALSDAALALTQPGGPAAEWLKTRLTQAGFEYRFLSGSMALKKRAKFIKEFQEAPPTTGEGAGPQFSAPPPPARRPRQPPRPQQAWRPVRGAGALEGLGRRVLRHWWGSTSQLSLPFTGWAGHALAQSALLRCAVVADRRGSTRRTPVAGSASMLQSSTPLQSSC